MTALQSHRNKKYNITYLIDGLGWGGAERLMIPILANLNLEIFSPRVVVFRIKNGNPVAHELKKINIPVELIEVPYLRDVTAPRRIIKYLQQTQTDLIHAQLEYGIFYGSIAAKYLHTPLVATMHTIPASQSKLKLKLHDALEYFLLRNFFNKVISVSDETRRFYKTAANLTDENSCTIYNGIDLTSYKIQAPHPDRQTVLSTLGIPPASSVLTTVAVLREPKGIQYMIRAMPAILKSHPQTYYLIVGDGEYNRPLREEAQAVGVKDRVIFAGTRNDIHNIMPVSDLFVLPTLTEALPTVLAEAMAASLPILASRVGGVPEMVQENVNGKLIPPKDPALLASACIEMLNNPQRLVEMGKAGREIVEKKFNIKIQINQLQNLYLHLLK